MNTAFLAAVVANGISDVLCRRRALPALVVGLLSLIAVVASTDVAVAQTSASSKKRPVPVQAAVVRKGDLRAYVTALGTVTATNSVVVRSRVDGHLVKLHAREGDMVKAGQLLAEIDPRPLQVQLAQAEARLAANQAQRFNAEQDLARYATLLEKQFISRQKLETQEALVRQYTAAMQVDQADVESAKLQLSYTKIRAPSSGLLGLRLVDVGNVVRASDSGGIVVINQLDPINVVFTLPEAQFPTVLRAYRTGRKLPVEAWDREQKNQLRTGRLASIDNQIDLATGTVKLKAEFANHDGLLFPNQFVNVRMLAETRSDSVLAPSAAVQRGRAGPFVYVVSADKSVALRVVKLGSVEGQFVEVVQGLAANEMVVTDGIDQLREGSKVEIVDPASLSGTVGKGRNKDASRSASRSANAQ